MEPITPDLCQQISWFFEGVWQVVPVLTLGWIAIKVYNWKR